MWGITKGWNRKQPWETTNKRKYTNYNYSCYLLKDYKYPTLIVLLKILINYISKLKLVN